MMDADMVVPFGSAEVFNRIAKRSYPEQFAGIHTIDYFLKRGKTLIGVLYVDRQEGDRPVYAEGMAPADYKIVHGQAPCDILKPTRWVGTGAVLIHRSVLEDILKKFPYLAPKDWDAKVMNRSSTIGHWFSSSEHEILPLLQRLQAVITENSSDIGLIRNLITRGLELIGKKSTLGMGEDVQFCIRAAEAGHIPHVDFSVIGLHVGEKVYAPAGKDK